MRLEIVIRVSEEKVVVEVPERGWRKEYANLAVIHQEKKLIVDLGRTIDEMQRADPKRWEENQAQYKFLPIYDPLAFDLNLSSNCFRYFKMQAFRESQPWFNQLFAQTDVTLWLPGDYLVSVGDIHKQFELILLQTLNLHTLTINGQVAGWPRWQRKLAMAYQTYPLWGTVFGFFFIIPHLLPWTNRFAESYLQEWVQSWRFASMVLYMVGLFVIPMICWLISGVLPLLFYRPFIPKNLLVFVLISFPQFSFEIQKKYTLNLVERLLIDDPIFSPKTS